MQMHSMKFSLWELQSYIMQIKVCIVLPNISTSINNDGTVIYIMVQSDKISFCSDVVLYSVNKAFGMKTTLQTNCMKNK